MRCEILIKQLNKRHEIKKHVNVCVEVCQSAVISAWLVRVWASADTTLPRTIARAVSEQ